MKFINPFIKSRLPTSDVELLASYRRTGDIRLVTELYQPYMQMVFSVCYKYLKDEEESKDAVMNIFEKMVSDLKIHEVQNFKSWLHSVARNHCLMLLRSERVFVSETEILHWNDENEEQEQQENLDLDVSLTALEKCMETLVYEQKVSVNLFFIEEKCYREISEHTGFEFNKVKSYIQNGKRNLKICMDKNGTR